MSPHRILPPLGGKRLLLSQFIGPSDRRRVEQDLGAPEDIHTCRLGKPLVVADQRSDHGLGRRNTDVSEVARREVVPLVVTGVMRDVHLAILSGQFSLLVVHHRGVEKLSSRRLLIERSADQRNSVPGRAIGEEP